MKGLKMKPSLGRIKMLMVWGEILLIKKKKKKEKMGEGENLRYKVALAMALSMFFLLLKVTFSLFPF